MSFLTGLALRRPAVTVLVIVLVMIGGVVTYQTLEPELFPEIEFPTIFVTSGYPSANPETVARDVTEPIEDSIAGMRGLREIRSTSTENTSVVVATFEFGEDMDDVESDVESGVNAIDFPDGVTYTWVSRIASDVFPVMQLSVVGDRDIPSLQRVVDDFIIPPIERIDGVFSATVLGRSDEQVHVTLNVERMEELGISADQIAGAIRDNNVSFPAGNIDSPDGVFAVRSSHKIGSLDELRGLVVGFEQVPEGRGERPIPLSRVAEVEIGTARATTMSRTNGKASLGIVVVKDPDANTVEVTSRALEAVTDIPGLPEDVEVVTLANDGPEVERSLDSLLNEGLWGLIFAITMVFIFLVNFRPGLLRGISIALRPTAIIGLSIPLSILTGIIIMGLAGLSLNFMSLAGLAISVGRVVDDSIVVLENIYRHMQEGKPNRVAAFEATREVGAAIVSSTLTTVVVFVPLGFIEGLVGSFFTPFAMTVSFALLASTLVALTAVPVLGLLLLRRGDFSDAAPVDDRDPLILRVYMPILRWALRRKIATLLIAIVVTGASLGLIGVIPITLFPSDAPEYLIIDLELPLGSSIGDTFEVVRQVEIILDGYRDRRIVEAYQVTLFARSEEFGSGGEAGGHNIAGILVTLHEDVPPDVAEIVRADMPEGGPAEITVSAVEAGPPADQLEYTVTGSNYTDIVTFARLVEDEVRKTEGIVNIASDVSGARDEALINIDPRRAGQYGITAASGARQVSRYVVGQTVSEADLEGVTMDIVVRGDPYDVNDIEKLKALRIEGPAGSVRLGAIADIAIEKGPVSISRFDGKRSASITGSITARDVQAVGAELQERIDALEKPPGVSLQVGGIFAQISEGFQDIFAAMAVGIVLVYLVMVASLGSLRNPFVIVMSLPLALVGALVALTVTGRTLSLSALMGLLLLIGVVVTNAIVLIVFVEQLRERGLGVYDALIEGSRVRLRPILMTAFTTTFALLPLASFAGEQGGIIGSELATVVIGGLISSTFLTLIVVPVVYTIVHSNLPYCFLRLRFLLRRAWRRRRAARARRAIRAGARAP